MWWQGFLVGVENERRESGLGGGGFEEIATYISRHKHDVCVPLFFRVTVLPFLVSLIFWFAFGTGFGVDLVGEEIFGEDDFGGEVWVFADTTDGWAWALAL